MNARLKLAPSPSVKRTRSGSTASEIPTMPHPPGEEPIASTSVPKPTPSTVARPRQKRGGGRKTVQVTDLGGAGDADEGEDQNILICLRISHGCEHSSPAEATEQNQG